MYLPGAAVYSHHPHNDAPSLVSFLSRSPPIKSTYFPPRSSLKLTAKNVWCVYRRPPGVFTRVGLFTPTAVLVVWSIHTHRSFGRLVHSHRRAAMTEVHTWYTCAWCRAMRFRHLWWFDERREKEKNDSLIVEYPSTRYTQLTQFRMKKKLQWRAA